jgi:hypothetical protein
MNLNYNNKKKKKRNLLSSPNQYFTLDIYNITNNDKNDLNYV